MSCWALVPVKARGTAKQRLATVLDATARSTLMHAMVQHVLEVLGQCAVIERIAVVTPDRERLPESVHWLADAGREVNRELRAALDSLAALGVSRIALVSADLPLLAAGEVGALVAASAAGKIALAPDRHGTGTNALALSLPIAFQPQFGPDSLVRHVAEAAKLGVEAVLVERPGLAFDVDEPEDLTILRARGDPRFALPP
ncbi:MAG TPA: 2-phospho-L-lactate guanylyltransferase [Steroidobacteraceae bacterium]|nr:2-phospho-L-lactate guanylyltransferase [Steroidobacteraceae bacterium]